MASINKITYVVASKLSTIRPLKPNDDSVDNSYDNYLQGKWKGWAESVNAVADACKELSPNFNKNKFIGDCND